MQSDNEEIDKEKLCLLMFAMVDAQKQMDNIIRLMKELGFDVKK